MEGIIHTFDIITYAPPVHLGNPIPLPATPSLLAFYLIFHLINDTPLHHSTILGMYISTTSASVEV